MKLQNAKVLLKVNLSGGSYLDFHFKDSAINPLNFRAKDPGQAGCGGHLLCFDRWGPPTEAERKNGFAHHGEVNALKWKVLGTQNSTGCIMQCALPMGRLQLTRKIGLSKNEPVFFVSEQIRNLNKYGRMFNIVQHVTIAPPFLDKTTLFDTNAGKGFEDKMDGSLNQETPVFTWPHAIHNNEKVDLRQFQDEWPLVSSFVFNQNDKYGWVTACNPGQGLMLGYVWKIEDYPWINFWRSMVDGIPRAFGMEFGTTGLHEPFPVVAKKGKIFDRNIYEFIDADEVIRKSFVAFLSRIPVDYKGVRSIEFDNGSILVKEEGITSRDIKYAVPELFTETIL